MSFSTRRPAFSTSAWKNFTRTDLDVGKDSTVGDGYLPLMLKPTLVSIVALDGNDEIALLALAAGAARGLEAQLGNAILESPRERGVGRSSAILSITDVLSGQLTGRRVIRPERRPPGIASVAAACQLNCN
jgi:hypothetical protein